MSFSSDLQKFARKYEQRQRDIFHGTVEEVSRSIVEGSPITGAAGQPVDTGHLRASFSTQYTSPSTAQISTNVEYAEVIENNERGATLRSAVGGFHSVKMTRVGFRRIVEAVTRRVVGGA